MFNKILSLFMVLPFLVLYIVEFVSIVLNLINKGKRGN